MRRPATGAPEFGKANFYSAGKTGFTEGTPGVEAATVVTDDTLNHVVGELANAIEVFGATALDAAKYDQLSTVLSAGLTRGLVVSAQNDVRTGFLQLTSLATGITGSVYDLQVKNSGNNLQLIAVGGTIGSASSIRYTNGMGGGTWSTSTVGSAYANAFIGTCDNLAYGMAGEIQQAVYVGSNPTTYARQKTGGADILSVCRTPDATLYIAIDSAGRMWTRTAAGSTWTDAGVKLGVGTVRGDLCTGLVAGVGFIAVCDGGQVKRTSNNGTTWTAVTLPGGALANRIIYTGQPGFEWVAGCEPGGMLKSTDLVTWTTITPAVPVTYTYALAPIVGGFIAMEYQPPHGVMTYDGVNQRFFEGINYIGFTPTGVGSLSHAYRCQRHAFAGSGSGGQVFLTSVVGGASIYRMAEAFPPPAGVYP